MSDEVENKELEGISRISEYSQAVKVFLSTIDELRERESMIKIQPWKHHKGS